jgi:hypothetical protein
MTITGFCAASRQIAYRRLSLIALFAMRTAQLIPELGSENCPNLNPRD